MGKLQPASYFQPSHFQSDRRSDAGVSRRQINISWELNPIEREICFGVKTKASSIYIRRTQINKLPTGKQRRVNSI